MDNKQAAEAMPPGEFQKVPEICNCQEPKCRKRVDAAIEAMREACARELEEYLKLLEKAPADPVSSFHEKQAIRNSIRIIRALKVEDVLK